MLKWNKLDPNLTRHIVAELLVLSESFVIRMVFLGSIINPKGFTQWFVIKSMDQPNNTKSGCVTKMRTSVAYPVTRMLSRAAFPVQMTTNMETSRSFPKSNDKAGIRTFMEVSSAYW